MTESILKEEKYRKYYFTHTYTNILRFEMLQNSIISLYFYLPFLGTPESFWENTRVVVNFDEWIDGL